MSRLKLLWHVLASLAKAAWWHLTRTPSRTDFTRGEPYTGAQAAKITDWQSRMRADWMLGIHGPFRPIRTMRPGWWTLLRLQWAMLRAIRYVSDQAGYGNPDYWATAQETLDRRTGDCEDQAAVAMLLMIRAGLPHTRIGGVWVREGDEVGGHVMAVYWDNARDPWIIDNDCRFAAPARASLLLGRVPGLRVECWFGVFRRAPGRRRPLESRDPGREKSRPGLRVEQAGARERPHWPGDGTPDHGRNRCSRATRVATGT